MSEPEFVKGGEASVGKLKSILNDFDDELIVKFRWVNDEWNLGMYWSDGNELVFTQPTRKIKEIGNRFVADHTTRKGSWIEDWMTGKKYLIDVDEDISELLDMLNEFDNQLNRNDSRFVLYYVEKRGRFVQDRLTGREYNLGISTSVCVLRDYLNEYDKLIINGSYGDTSVDENKFDELKSMEKGI